MIDLLNISKDDNFLSQLDPRSKVFFILNMILVTLIINNLIFLIFYFIVLYIIIAINFGKFYLLNAIWYMKYYFIILIAMYFILTDFDQIGLSILILKIFIMIFSFYVFNKSTNPDEIIEALIRLKFPVKISWLIGTTLRQTIFLADDVKDVIKIHENRSQFNKNHKNTIGFYERFLLKIKKLSPLINSTFSRSIMNAIDLGDTLYLRNFNGAHKNIMIKSLKMSRFDVLFIFLTIILPNLCTLSVLYMKYI